MPGKEVMSTTIIPVKELGKVLPRNEPLSFELSKLCKCVLSADSGD